MSAHINNEPSYFAAKFGSTPSDIDRSASIYQGKPKPERSEFVVLNPDQIIEDTVVVSEMGITIYGRPFTLTEKLSHLLKQIFNPQEVKSNSMSRVRAMLSYH